MLKKVIALLMAAAMALTVAGCTGGGAGSTTAPESTAAESPADTPADTPADEPAADPAPEGGEPTAVKIAHTPWVMSWLGPIIEEYNASQSQYKIEGIEVASGEDMYTKMTMMLQSPKTCPDIMLEDGFMINADVAAGRLMPLEDVLKDWDELQQFMPSVLEGSKAEDGKLYGLPISTDTQGIYYNKVLLEKVGVSSPWQPKDWAEITDVAKKLKEANASVEDFIPLFLYASKTTQEETSMRTFQALLSGTPGTFPEQLYDKTEGKWIVDTANLKKVFDFVNEVYNVAQVGPKPSIASQPKIGDVLVSDYMQNDKMGMYFTGSWTMGSFGEKGQFPWPEAMEHWGFANIPTYDGAEPKYTTMSGGWTWAIPANANNKDGAAEFLKILGSKESQMAQLAASGEITVRSDIATDETYLNQSPSVVREATEQLAFTHFRPSVDGYSTLTAMFTSVVESIAIGTATPDQALETFKSEMIRLVGEDKVTVK